jgi:hypothetical protein
MIQYKDRASNTMKNYIPVELWKSTFSKPPFLVFVEKVPLSKIKIDKSLFSFQNEVDPEHVNFMAKNFDIDFWMPIIVTPDYFLLDGQHRLQVAKKLGLKYIDVVIDSEHKQ